jgi:hypothetical protein
LLPAVQAAREAARRAQCSNNLKQMGLAIHNFMGEHDQRIPMGVRAPSRCSLFTYMLPYMEEQALFDSIDLAKAPWDTANKYAYYTLVATYICPSYRGEGLIEGTNPADYRTGGMTTYQGVCGKYPVDSGVSVEPCSPYGDMPNNGAFGWKVKRSARDVIDGLSNTLFIAEFVHSNTTASGATTGYPGNVRPWIRSNNGTGRGSYSFKVVEFTINARLNRDDSLVKFNHLPMGSHHPGGANFLVGDGSVHFLSENIDLETYKELCTVDGGEHASLPN